MAGNTMGALDNGRIGKGLGRPQFCRRLILYGTESGLGGRHFLKKIQEKGAQYREATHKHYDAQSQICQSQFECLLIGKVNHGLVSFSKYQ
jgi:hypothetical protein